MECGNIKLSKTIEMEINTIGNALFYDTDFIKSSINDPEWLNFKQKIKNEKNINIENTCLIPERRKRIIRKINKLIYGTDDKDKLKEIIDGFSEEQKNIIFSGNLFGNIIFGYFRQLKTNISNFLPLDIPQDKLAQYTFAKHVNKFVNYTRIMIKGDALPLYEHKDRASMIEKSILFFFRKNEKGLYEPTMNGANELIKSAFKSAGKNLDALKLLVDTDKGRSLSNVSTTWKTFKKLLDNEDAVFDRIDRSAVISYKQSYLIYMLLKNFEKSIDEFIPQIIRSKMIEDILNNMDYLKSLQDLHFSTVSTTKYKTPASAMEYILYDDNKELRSSGVNYSLGYFGSDSLDIDYFYYNRNNPDDMQPLLNYGHQEKYIDSIFGVSGRTEYFTSKHIYGKEKFSKETELYFLEKYCSENTIGKSSTFFFKWYVARIEYAEYHRGKSTIEKVSQAYLEAYDAGLYFSGKYTAKFVEEAINVFLEEYKLTKRTGRIKEIYQYATALGLTLQLYKQFKEADFSDPAINPYECYIKLWDSGYDVMEIANYTDSSWQMVRKILYDNKKFLRRNDEASLNDLGRYITKWECDEYGIDSDEIWDN